MTATIDTLARDLQNVIGSEKGRELAKDAGIQIGALVAKKMEKALTRDNRPRRPSVLFPSELGHPCNRKTWFSFHYDPSTMHPREELGGAARIKFAYGDIIESMIIPLIHIAGHEVTDVNKRIKFDVIGMEGWTVEGAMDLKVDGEVVDVKSMNAHSFDNWLKDPVTADKFGYNLQLNSYVHAEGLASHGHVLAVNKENGKIDRFTVGRCNPNAAAVAKARAVEAPLYDLAYMPNVPLGKNSKLGVTCSYCEFKRECWKNANGGKGLRKFMYASGPVWLTEVVEQPRVLEVPV